MGDGQQDHQLGEMLAFQGLALWSTAHFLKDPKSFGDGASNRFQPSTTTDLIDPDLSEEDDDYENVQFSGVAKALAKEGLDGASLQGLREAEALGSRTQNRHPGIQPNDLLKQAPSACYVNGHARLISQLESHFVPISDGLQAGRWPEINSVE